MTDGLTDSSSSSQAPTRILEQQNASANRQQQNLNALGGAAVRTCDGGLPTFVRFSHQRCSGHLNDTSLRHPDDIRDLSIFDRRDGVKNYFYVEIAGSPSLPNVCTSRRVNREKMGRKQDRREKTEKGQTKKRFTPPKYSRRLVRPQRFFPYVASLNMMYRHLPILIYIAN